VFGASTRAAAFSALRAGLRPWCGVLFNDADLIARCPTVGVSRAEYPRRFLEVIRQAPTGSWLYTGGLENRRSLINRLAAIRPLWGNDSSVLAVVRSPHKIAAILEQAGFFFPAIHFRPDEVPSSGAVAGGSGFNDIHFGPDDRPSSGRWLVKPCKSSGGSGITFFLAREDKRLSTRRKRFFIQEYITGVSCAAAYLGDGQRARLLGVTRQLIAESWLNARRFHYCGSVGPLPLSDNLRQTLERLGDTVVAASRMKGLFGIDFILQEDIPWLVEINPRYTASMEVIEFGLNLPIMALHRRIFDSSAPTQTMPDNSFEPKWIGKAILFARDSVRFPGDGPWLATLRNPSPITMLPAFGDIPAPGQTIAKDCPILTVFAKADSFNICLDALQQKTRDLDHWLYER